MILKSLLSYAGLSATKTTNSLSPERGFFYPRYYPAVKQSSTGFCCRFDEAAQEPGEPEQDHGATANRRGLFIERGGRLTECLKRLLQETVERSLGLSRLLGSKSPLR